MTKRVKNIFILFFTFLTLFIGLFSLSKMPIKNQESFFKKIIQFIKTNPNCQNIKYIIKSSLKDNSISINEQSLINWEIKDCNSAKTKTIIENTEMESDMLTELKDLLN